MKYLFAALTVLGTLCPSGNLWAQGGQPYPGAAGFAPQSQGAPAAAKIGVVNLGVLYRDQEKAKVIGKQLQAKLKPYKEKQEELEKYINAWTKALREPDGKLTEKQREDGYKALCEAQRRMQDLQKEYHSKMGSEMGGDVVALNNEIKQAIKLYAELNGYHLILGYGEPEVPLEPLPEYQRRMSAIDGGHISFVPPTGAFNPDITRAVLDLMNSSYRASMGVKQR